MALKGTLKDFSVADIFQLIGQQQKSGSLYVRVKDREAHIVFDGGRVVLGTFRKSDEDLLLGTMLLRAGVITADQLSSAIENQKVTLRSLGDILKSMGAINNAVLAEFVSLQLREVLFRLFQWKEGLYEFVAEQIQYNKAIIKPLAAEGVLMDGFRMLDEWPGVTSKTGNLESVFRPFGDWVELPEDAPEEEQRVAKLVDGHRSLQEMIYRSRLGTFETARIIASFLDRGLVQKVDQLSQTRIDFQAAKPIPATLAPWARLNLLPLIGVLMFSFALPWLAFRIPSHAASRFQAYRAAEGRGVSGSANIRALHRQDEIDRLRFRIDSFRLEQGKLPSTLSEVVSESMADKWDYHRFEDGYDLAPMTGQE